MRIVRHRFPLPIKDSADNNSFTDVIGNKTDREEGNSIYSNVHTILEHVHSSSKCYPTLANGVSIASSSISWTLGNFVQIVPANIINEYFDIHFLNIASASASDTYELVLYAVTSEIARIRFTRAQGDQSVAPIPIITPLIQPNTQIQAKLACAGGASRSAVVSIIYHMY